ncbi:hypothetical protein CsatB_018167 [Cannabis sativa]
MSHLSSEVCPPKLITLGCTNHSSSPYVPKDFKPQLEPETMDSKAEELPADPNQGNPVDRYVRSSQVILEGKNRHRSCERSNRSSSGAWFRMNPGGKLAWFLSKNPTNPRPKPAPEDLYANLSLVSRNFLRLGLRSRLQEMGSFDDENEVYAEVETFYM